MALTAKLAQEDVSAYLAAGFEGVAAKPINVADLAAEMDRLGGAEGADEDAEEEGGLGGHGEGDSRRSRGVPRVGL